MIKLFVSMAVFLQLLVDFYATGSVDALILFILYSLIMFLVLTLLNRWHLFLSLPALIVSALIVPYFVLTGSHVSYNVILSILESDYEESTELVGSVFFIKYLVIFLIISVSPFFVSKIKIIRNLEFNVDRKVALCMFPVVSVVLYLYSSMVLVNNTRSVIYSDGIYSYFPLKHSILLNRTLVESKFLIDDYRAMKINLDVIETDSIGNSLILVIGEAARKKSMQIYGSSYQTTPRLKEIADASPDKVVVFHHVVSVAPFTRVAVPSMVSMAGSRRFDEIASTPSVYKIINETEIESTFLANAKESRFGDALINEMIKDNDAVVTHDGRYDMDLMGPLAEAINIRQEINKLITIQLSGSHYRYNKRYPETWNCFLPDTPDSNYLSSIRYTDYVLSELIELVDLSSKPYAIIYTSDHGEYVNEDGDQIYGHGFKKMTRNEIDIPLVIVFNEAFLQKNKKLVMSLNRSTSKYISLDNISHTILGVLGVSEATYYDASYDLGSELMKEHKVYVINRDMNGSEISEYNFEESKLGGEKDNITMKGECQIKPH